MNKERIALAVTLAAALAACSNAKSSGGGSPQPSGAATAASAAATASPVVAATPDCHGESPVWALGRVKAFLLPGDPHYGKTKHGEYMCLSEAESQGYHEARGRRHHHRRQGALTP